jgi:hypothetical protein
MALTELKVKAKASVTLPICLVHCSTPLRPTQRFVWYKNKLAQPRVCMLVNCHRQSGLLQFSTSAFSSRGVPVPNPGYPRPPLPSHLRCCPAYWGVADCTPPLDSAANSTRSHFGVRSHYGHWGCKVLQERYHYEIPSQALGYRKGSCLVLWPNECCEKYHRYWVGRSP